MSDFEEKRQRRIDHFKEKAAQARAESDALAKQGHDMLHAIPFGQPIIGPSDRRYRERAGDKLERAVKADSKAAYYERKAEAAENNTAISSDDPDAIEKLTAVIENLQRQQTRMKQINAYYRKNGTCRGFHGLTDEEADKLDQRVATGYSWEKAPYPPYALSNNNQNIRRYQERLKQLTQARELGYVGWEFEGGKVVADSEANRLQVFFDEIPPESVRDELKSRGFKWARSVGAWQRQLTDNAIWSASRIEAIRPKDGSDPVMIQPKKKKKSGPTR